MKIGILTFHRANNLGAVLQASALLKYMQDNFGDCELIDFYPNNSIPVNNGIVHKILHVIKQILTFPKSVKIERRAKSFEAYRKEYYKVSVQAYYGDEDIKNRQPFYDVLISGSDQILNTTLTGNSMAFYLNFDNKAKKISYASSFGRDDITQDELNLVKSELPSFYGLSVREQSAGDIIKEATGIDAALVVDPVFLLSADEWSFRCSDNTKLPEKYIFVYSMEVSENLEIALNQIKKEYNFPVIVVKGGGKSGKIEGKEDISCGPAEFLRYIRDAEIVITNSFHGTAFSIIFQKKFVCIAHSSRNARLENIMSMVECNDHLISNNKMSNDAMTHITDGMIAMERMNKYICISKDYLYDLLDCAQN